MRHTAINQGHLSTAYVRANDKTIARVKNGVTTFIHSDHLGSAQVGTDGSGLMTFQEYYTPFGEVINASAENDNQAGFTGHIRDTATGLTYMQARYYDPNIGRFLSIDPVTFMDTGNPGYFNRYAYTMNDPINLLDPTGMIIECAESGSCTNEDGTELFNISSIPDDGSRAIVGGAINSLSKTGDFQSNAEAVVSAEGSSIAVNLKSGGSRSHFGTDNASPTIDIGTGDLSKNFRVSESETNSAAGGDAGSLFNDTMQSNQRTLFGGATHPVTAERIIAHEGTHLYQERGAIRIGGAPRRDEIGVIRATNSFMYRHAGEPGRATGYAGRNMLVPRK